MIVLRVDALQLEECVVADQLGVRMQRRNQRPAGEVAIHDEFEDIVVTAVLVEVPEIVVGLVKEIQAVETLHPADFHLDVEVLLVVLEAAALLSFLELIHADRVTFGNDGPIGWIAVDARNLVGGELENFVLDAGTFDCEGAERESKE